MIIQIKYDKVYSINIHKFSSLFKLKELIKQKIPKLNNFNYKFNKCYLKFNNKILNDDNKSLDFYKIKNNDIINLSYKLKGGVETIQLIGLIICCLFVFLIIPILLFTGIIPFYLHVIQCIILKVFNFIVDYFVNLPRIKKFEGIFKSIIKFCIYGFKIFFIYFGLSVIFTLTFFCWTIVINKGKNLFDVSEKYCADIKLIKEMSYIGTIIYLVTYSLFRLPNIIFHISEGFSVISKKNGFGIFVGEVLQFNRTNILLQTAVYNGKWGPFNAIPGLTAIFNGINIAFMILQEISGLIAQYGCRNDKGELTKSSFDKIKGKLKNKISKMKKGESIESSKNNKKDNIVCCNKESFALLYNSFDQLHYIYKNNIYIKQRLKRYGIKEITLKILKLGFNEKYTKDGLENFRNASFIFKFKDNNIKGYAAYMLRLVFCNIVNISNQISNILLKIGTPEDMGDTVKCGFIAGAVSSFFYYVAILYILINHLYPKNPNEQWYNILFAVLAFVVCMMIKRLIPIFPLPLIA